MNLPRLVNKFLGIFAIQLNRISNFDASQVFIRDLLDKGITFNTFFDIGAFKGEYTEKMFRIMPSCDFYLFEANKIHELHLAESGHQHFITVLSDDEVASEWWSLGGTGDSLFRENQIIYEVLKPEIRMTRKLDNLVQTENLPMPDIVKIDVQGAELQVMKGGLKTISKSKVILLEVPILTYNLGSPEFNSYIRFMKEIGFVPVELLEVHKADNLLVQVDIAFMNLTFAREIYGIGAQGLAFLK